jgi:chromosome condensin MukBEF ATPase and DNA-binding subunit MukB
MEAINKKMQSMKVEKDNACDRCDVSEEASKASIAEDEVAELVAKARQLETELDMTAEKASIVSLQLEEKEKTLLAAEAEMNALNRRVQGLEEDLEKTEEKLVAASAKLDNCC